MADEPETTSGTEGGEAAAEGAADAGKAKKKKMMLIISSAVAVLGVLVAVGVVFFMGGEEKPHEPAAEGEGAAAHLVIYDVPEFNVSLLSEDPAAPHFIKIKVALELAKQTDVEAVNQMLPRLQDDWGGLLRQMRVGDLQGSANLHRLKENLLRRALQSLAPVELKAVYIRELLVQ
jgi:flagellar protein FliL